MGIGARVVRQEEPEKTKDKILKSECQPINISPGRVISDNARENTSYENAEEQSRDYDRDGSCTPMRRSQVTDQRQHYQSVNCGFFQSRIRVFILNCGVTVVNDVRNVRKQKTGKELVMQRPSLLPRRQIRENAIQTRYLNPLTKQSP